MTPNVKHGNWTLTLPLAGLGLAYLFLFFLPAQRALDSLNRTLSSEQDTVSQADTLRPAIALTEQELAKSKKRNSQWIDAVPSENELPSLFAKVNALSKAAGIATTHLTPQPTVQYEKVRLVTLAVGYRGSFAQLSRFLGDLESLPESVWIDQLQLDGTSKTGQDIACEVSLTIFADKTDESDQVKGSG